MSTTPPHDSDTNAKLSHQASLHQRVTQQKYQHYQNEAQFLNESAMRDKNPEQYREYVARQPYREPYINPHELNRYKFSEWWRQIRVQRLFKFTMVFTILSGIGSSYAVWDDRQNQTRRHEGIFKDIIRQNVRRRLNGLVALSDEEVEVRYGTQVREEFQEWCAKNGDVIRDVEKKSMSPEAMYRARRQDVV